MTFCCGSGTWCAKRFLSCPKTQNTNRYCRAPSLTRILAYSSSGLNKILCTLRAYRLINQRNRYLPKRTKIKIGFARAPNKIRRRSIEKSNIIPPYFCRTRRQRTIAIFKLPARVFDNSFFWYSTIYTYKLFCLTLWGATGGTISACYFLLFIGGFKNCLKVMPRMLIGLCLHRVSPPCDFLNQLAKPDQRRLKTQDLRASLRSVKIQT